MKFQDNSRLREVRIMSQPSPRSNLNKTYISGSILILIGILILMTQVVQAPLLSMSLIPGLGLLFIAWALLMRNFGLLIPGGILVGVGAGVLLIEMHVTGLDDGAAFMIAFGLGWMLITLLSPLTTREVQWWPLIPGGIIMTIGLLIQQPWGHPVLMALSYLWPLSLVALGGYLIFKAHRREKEQDEV